MNMFLHDYTDAVFAIGDTFTKPGFGSEGAGLTKFDYVVANPMWNRDNYAEEFYDHDTWGRFTFGNPPRSSADWAWAQHILASLGDQGRAAIVLDTGAVSRGSGGKSSNKEREICKGLVEADLIEGVVLVPENLFYNTTAPGIILLLVRAHDIANMNSSAKAHDIANTKNTAAAPSRLWGHALSYKETAWTTKTNSGADDRLSVYG